jgi:hypothetical protein
MLEDFVGSRKKRLKAYAVHTLCVASLVAPEAATPAADLLQQMMGADDQFRHLALNGFAYLLTANPAALNEQQLGALRAAVAEAVRGDNSDIAQIAAALWCVIAVATGEADQEDLGLVLPMLPPPVDDDDIPFVGRFLSFAMPIWAGPVGPHAARIAVNVMASGEWLVRLIPQEAIIALCAIVGEFPDDDVLAILKWNYCHFAQLQKNLGRATSQ